MPPRGQKIRGGSSNESSTRAHTARSNSSHREYASAPGSRTHRERRDIRATRSSLRPSLTMVARPAAGARARCKRSRGVQEALPKVHLGDHQVQGQHRRRGLYRRSRGSLPRDSVGRDEWTCSVKYRCGRRVGVSSCAPEAELRCAAQPRGQLGMVCPTVTTMKRPKSFSTDDRATETDAPRRRGRMGQQLRPLAVPDGQACSDVLMC